MAGWEAADSRRDGSSSRTPITRADAERGVDVGFQHLDTGFFRARWDRVTPAESEYLSTMAIEVVGHLRCFNPAQKSPGDSLFGDEVVRFVSRSGGDLPATTPLLEAPPASGLVETELH